MATELWDAFPDLAPFVQFKKREKDPWRSVILVKFQTSDSDFTTSSTTPWVFSRSFICTNGAKSRKTSHILPHKRFIRDRCSQKYYSKKISLRKSYFNKIADLQHVGLQKRRPSRSFFQKNLFRSYLWATLFIFSLEQYIRKISVIWVILTLNFNFTHFHFGFVQTTNFN